MAEAAEVIDVEPQDVPASAKSRAVAKRGDGAHSKNVSVRKNSDPVLALIERAARDPAVDIDKMRALLDMRAQLQAQDAERVYGEAMTLAQEEMEPVRKDCTNAQTKSKYTSYAALDRAIRPIYTRCGFSISFSTEASTKESNVLVVATVQHSGGHKCRHEIDMPADGKGAKGGDVMTKTHAMMSAVTYGKRCLKGMIFDIAVYDDDDGNVAGGKAQPKNKEGAAAPSGLITDAQYEEVRAKIDDAGANIGKFCGHFKIDGVQQLPAAKFREAMGMLDRFAAQKGARR